MAIFDRLVTIRDCLCEQIKTDGLCDVSFCGIVPGESAAADYFSCGSGKTNGMAWVRLVSSYLATSVGASDLTIDNCGKDIGFDVEIGIMRCAPLAGENGRAPTAKVVHEAAAQQIADMETMFRAIRCCDEIGGKDHVIGAYAPLGPEGGIVGGVLTLSLI